jgi:TolB-like protein
MPFKPLRVDPQLEWMQEAIRDNFNGQLSNASDLKIYAKEYIDFLVRKEPATEIEVANRLGVVKMISGSFLASADRLRIEAHIVDVQSGLLEASDHVEGALGDFFKLQAQLTSKLLARLDVDVSPNLTGSESPPPPASSLDAYKLLLEAEGETMISEPAAEDHSPAESLPTKEMDPLSRLLPRWIGESIASAQETPSQPERATIPEEEIHWMLEVYRQAYEKKDLHLLDTVYVTLAPAQKDANLKYFQNTKNLRVRIRDVDIAVKGDEAVVSYTREDQFLDTKTGQGVKLETRFTKLLERKDGTWKIVVGPR